MDVGIFSVRVLMLNGVVPAQKKSKRNTSSYWRSSYSVNVPEVLTCLFFFLSSRRRHTRFDCDWSSDVCSSDLDKIGHGVDRSCSALDGQRVPLAGQGSQP